MACVAYFVLANVGIEREKERLRESVCWLAFPNNNNNNNKEYSLESEPEPEGSVFDSNRLQELSQYEAW